MKKIKLLLTEKEYQCLLYHIEADKGYGLDGTYGDGRQFISFNPDTGETYTSKADLRAIEKIINKLKKSHGKL